MFSRLLTKYGLATHLALLASLPLALSPFLAAPALATVVFFLSGLALLALLAEPSMRQGEHLSLARRRVMRSMLGDPFCWFMLAAVVFALVRWLNSGVALRFDPEQAQWLISEPALAFAPASVDVAGRLPFAVACGGAVLAAGIRHGIGLTARISMGLTASFAVGLAGLSAAGCAIAGCSPFVDALSVDFSKGPCWGCFFGIWLICSFAFGAQAESRKWGMGRLPFCIAVAGNATGLFLFSPPLLAAGYLVVAVLFAVFCFFYVGRSGSTGAVARMVVLSCLGFAVPFFFLVALLPESVREAKIQGLDISLAFSESIQQMSATLSRIARDIWQKMPWCGVGVGAFGLHVPFLAEKADWALLPPEPSAALNGFWNLLAERGILGCLVMAVGTGMLLYSWVRRLCGAVAFLRHNAESDVFAFACPPVVWTVPLILPLFSAEAVFTSVFSLVPVLYAVLVPTALAAASFPKRPSSDSSSVEKGN